tara:strand:- start:831 stop:4067 length:3237 start_codon:yes stop_codon:yes gene_type:complete
MAYKRNTSFTGYRSRLTTDESRELANAAKAADKQRVEQVKGMERASSQQITELSRLSDLEAKADAYEIQNLAKFSQSLNSALQTGAKVLGKDYIDKKRTEAINDYRAGLAGDPDALARTAPNEEQVAEINDKLNKLEIETQKKLTEAERNEKFLNYEQKYRLLNAKKVGRNYAYGYTKAHMMEAANGFLPWFINQTNENKEEVEFDDGRKITINKYDTLTSAADRYAVENRLIKDYQDLHNISGVNYKIVDTYLTQNVTKQLQAYRDKKLNDEIQTNAAESIRLQQVNLDAGVKLFKTDNTVDFDNAVDNILITGRALHFEANTTGSSGEANKNNLKTTFIDSVSALDSDAKIISVLKHIETKKYEIPSLGTKTLVEAFPIDFRMADLKTAIFSKRDDNITKKIRKDTIDLKTKIAELKFGTSLNDDDDEFISFTDYKLQVNELSRTKQYGALPESATIFANALNYSPIRLSSEKSDKAVRQELSRFGSIDAKTFMTLSTEDKTKYKSKLTKDIRWDQTTKGKKAIKEYIGEGSKFDDALTNSFLGPNKGLLNSATKSIALQNAIEYAKETYVWEVKKDLQARNAFEGQIDEDEDEDLYYFERAAEAVVLQMQKARGDNEQTSQQLFDSGNIFALNYGAQSDQNIFVNPKFREGDTSTASIIEKKELDKNNFTKIQSTIDLSTDPDPILANAESIFDNATKKESLNFIESNGVYDGESLLIQKLAYNDPKKRDPFTLGNALRQKFNLPLVKIETLPEDRKRIIEFYQEQGAEIRELLASRYPKMKERGIDMSGLISVGNLHRAISTAGFDHTDMDDGEIATILEKEKFTRKQFNEDDSIKERVFKIHVNDLLTTVIAGTDNKLVAIQKVAAEFGEGKEWYNKSNKAITKSVLSAYYHGWNPNTKEDFVSVFEDADGTVTRRSPSEFSSETNNMSSNIIQVEIDELVEPPQYVKGSNNRRSVNPEWKTYTKNKQKLESQKRILQSIESGDEDNFYGLLGANVQSKTIYYDLVSVFGRKEFDKLRQKAEARYFKETKFKDSPLRLNLAFLAQRQMSKAFSDIFLEELKKTSQFYMLESDE